MKYIKIEIISYVIAVALAILPAITEASWNPELERYAGGTAAPSEEIGRAVDRVVSLFPQVRGTIIAEEEGRITVRIDSAVPVKEGARLTVMKKGAPFRHPLTNELIGETEHLSGRVEVLEQGAAADLYICSVVEGDAATGDSVRIPSSNIKMAFFQDRKADWNTSETFYSALKDSGRFEILETYAPVFEPEALSELARGIGAEVVLTFSTSVERGGSVLSLKLYWAKDAQLYKELVEQGGTGSASSMTPGSEFILADAWKMELLGTYSLKGGQLVAVGDIDRNGEDEFIVSDGNDIRIYSESNNALMELWHLKGNRKGRHVSLDVLDLNRNGYPEIFVTSMTGNRISSFVLEYGDAGYERIVSDMPYFFRVLGDELLMQRFNHSRFFGGPVLHGEWRDGSYRPGAAVDLPDGVNIYGFSYIDWRNSGERELVTFDDRGFMHLFDSQGTLVWTSEEYIDVPYQAYRTRELSDDGQETKWYIRSKIVPVPTARGNEIIVVRKILNVNNVPGLGSSRGELISLWWNGDDMDKTELVKEIYGVIGNYAISDNKIYVIARSGALSFVKRLFRGNVSKGGILYYYNLGDK